MSNIQQHYELTCEAPPTHCPLYDHTVGSTWWDHIVETQLVQSIRDHLAICSGPMQVTFLEGTGEGK